MPHDRPRIEMSSRPQFAHSLRPFGKKAKHLNPAGVCERRCQPVERIEAPGISLDSRHQGGKQRTSGTFHRVLL
jgi:hypothetical protein